MLPQFGTAVRKKNLGNAVTADLGGAAPDKASVDAAWLVLEAANDLGDHAAVDACRRVIDAELNGTAARSSDVDLVLGYFR
ncbi:MULTISPECIES: hypothetical protein [Bradyrhizobium]|uniref:Uncharacterized protein n=1 Tax=Bradyrhizobium vignae TaxID=1549949 RepID=A0A2U3PXE8_9BRAD|nr:hypothetical protein [Bradyrhizobium vignae]MBP0109641.1 hypothetical protein [Bradyrhizobium vignae]RXH02279.1 hypothetical protein EAV90_16430 [Bradyrhizobium vignae]SPP93776.1 conserved protein of unknown function [Bradyrhizobium vignae]